MIYIRSCLKNKVTLAEVERLIDNFKHSTQPEILLTNG